jgi:hypothetical protein
LARGFGVGSFFREAEYLVVEARFQYLGVRHTASGFLTWRPERGYHLELLGLRATGKLPSPIVFGPPKAISRKDRTLIRMRLRDQGRAFTPPLPIDDSLGHQIVSEDRLSLDLPSLYFTALPAPRLDPKAWTGSAILDVGGSVHWPDAVTQTTRLDDKLIEENFSRSGLSYRGPTTTVVGRYEEGRHLRVYWSLDKTQYTKLDSWRFAEALQDALRVMLSRSVHLLERETDSPRRRLERRSPFKVRSTGPFVLFDDMGPLQKERLLQLTAFFLKDGPEPRIARKIVGQLLRAWRQSTWSDMQLLLSTILEATLRAWDSCPSSEKSWRLGESMARFRERHLTPSWRVACHRAVRVFEQLRHPTAHPDWRLEDLDPARDSERAQSLGEMTFLSRFYGYMILALAGFKDLDPVFQGRRMASTEASAASTSAPPADKAIM